MRKCHYIYDKEIGKVLIPGCYGMLHTEDMSNCTCRDYPETFAQFEKKEYNIKLQELKLQVIELEKENSSLHRIIKKLCQKQKNTTKHQNTKTIGV